MPPLNCTCQTILLLKVWGFGAVVFPHSQKNYASPEISRQSCTKLSSAIIKLNYNTCKGKLFYRYFVLKLIFYKLREKSTVFKSLRVNFWEINKVTLKFQMGFRENRRSKVEEVNSTIEFCILELL